MDSDDQNANRKCDSDDNILVEYKMNIADDINDNEEDQHCIKNQYLDGNGNQVNGSEKGQIQNNKKVVECSSCMETKTTTTTTNTTTASSNPPNEDSQMNDKIMKKLQAMSISDDDYGEFWPHEM